MPDSWFVDPVPCAQCGHKPTLLFSGSDTTVHRVFLRPAGRCSDGCGGRGVVSMDYRDPDTLPPRERLALVRAGRLVTFDLARASLARRWNVRQGPFPAGGARGL